MAKLYVKSPEGKSCYFELKTDQMAGDFGGYQNHYAVFSNGFCIITYWWSGNNTKITWPFALWLPSIVATKVDNNSSINPTVSHVAVIVPVEGNIGGLIAGHTLRASSGGWTVVVVGAGNYG